MRTRLFGVPASILCRFSKPRTVPLAVEALAYQEMETAALRYIGELGGPGKAKALVDLAKRSPSADVVIGVPTDLLRKR